VLIALFIWNLVNWQAYWDCEEFPLVNMIITVFILNVMAFVFAGWISGVSGLVGR
jgi:hypothetical protein